MEGAEPFSSIEEGNSHLGWKAMKRGEVGAIVLAGGQGTRLGHPGPKGTFPISPVHGKTLFQLLAERVAAASRAARKPLPVALMTSPANHNATVAYFEERDFFGLEKGQVSFFSQTTLPFLDEKGDLFLDRKGRIAEGPDGNGGFAHHFFASGLAAEWERLGIKYLSILPIDNALADPFDPELTGLAVDGVDVAIKAIERVNPQERVGVLVSHHGRPNVIEYSEVSEELRLARMPEGRLRWPCANISLYCITLSFAKLLSQEDLPLHCAVKAAERLGISGEVERPERPWARKFEHFIFDMLPMANRVAAMMAPREMCFAPLKNAEGSDSVATAQAAMMERDRQLYRQKMGEEPPSGPIELPADFCYEGMK